MATRIRRASARILPILPLALLLTPGFLAKAPASAEEGDAASRLLTDGRGLASSGDLSGAYSALSASLRAATDQDGKDAARDALLALATPPFPALSDGERDIVVARIDEERTRYLRQRANALLSAGHLRGALLLLGTIKGTLEEEATARVIGDPKSAERREREVSDLKVRILGDLDPDEKKRLEALREETRGEPAKIWRAAETQRKEGRLRVARRLLQEILFQPNSPEEWKDRSRKAVEELETAILDDLAPEERKAVDEALGQPVFGRLQVVTSREFIYIGDGDLVKRIPERSRYLLDLAYLSLTDLCGRVPNPDGARVSIFFKELWDFNGGVGGGTRIDIGNADPKAKAAVTVSTGLYFHELSHCIFDLDPGFPGWTEGIANFGAAFAMQFLRLETDEWHSARGNLEAFRRDFLGREEAYWRMAPYGPSAGWFLHFADAHGRRPSGEPDWIRWGRLFRRWRNLDPRPEAVTSIARGFSHLLVTEFGEGAWKDLAAMGFPCEGGPEEAAKDAVERPDLLRRAFSGDGGAERALLEEHRGSREAAAVLRERLRAGAGDDAFLASAAADLGVLRGWKVCGPFHPEDGEDGLAAVHPPRAERVWDATYRTRQEIARWRDPAPDGPVKEDPTGEVEVRWPYPENVVTYGALDIEVPATVDAWAWVASDHRWSLWIDDLLVEQQEWDPGRFIPDRDRVPVRLEKGTHRVLFKAVASWYGSNWAVRFTDTAGVGIPGLRCRPAAAWTRPPAPEVKWKGVLREDYGRGSFGSWKTGPGGFLLRNRMVRGTNDRGGVPWRKYSVRPGFPQDDPSNQATLDPRALAKAGKDLRVVLRVSGGPKVAVTLDAEAADGGLTGWTVVIVPRGERVEARVERYDRLIHQGVAAMPPAEEGARDLVVERRNGLLTVSLAGEVLLDRVSAPPLRVDGLRLCTWGKDPALLRFELWRAE